MFIMYLKERRQMKKNNIKQISSVEKFLVKQFMKKSAVILTPVQIAVIQNALNCARNPKIKMIYTKEVIEETFALMCIHLDRTIDKICEA